MHILIATILLAITSRFIFHDIMMCPKDLEWWNNYFDNWF